MNNTLGLYIHIPFCRSFCPYCDFYKVRADRDLMKQYEEAVVNTTASFSRLATVSGDAGKRTVDSVYFGGGTPSAMDGASIAAMLDAARRCFDVTADAEITVECNPSSDLESFLPAVAAAGVNRVSLGLQSASDPERRSLGRTSGRDRVARAVGLAREAGITNLSLDVMLGVPGQTETSLSDTLDFVVSQGVTHVSAYMLQLEEGTVFWKKRDSLELPDESKVCDLYSMACDVLEQNGLRQYEISNFAVPGCESRHNLKYWTLDEYLGIGPAAHSFLGGRRFFFPADLPAFLDHPDPVDDGPGGSEEERLMLGLRLTRGVSGISAETLAKIKDRPHLAGLVETEGNTLRLTRRGFLVSNSVIATILEMI